MKCEICGNEYDKAFEVIKDGERHTFDSFECAAHALAPRCGHCGVKILGHGVESLNLTLLSGVFASTLLTLVLIPTLYFHLAAKPARPTE